MSFIYKKIPRTILVVLAIISLFISRALFTLVDDPEGPNLLIVVVLAVGIFVVECVVYLSLKRGEVGR
jgi:hypothetical protein